MEQSRSVKVRVLRLDCKIYVYGAYRDLVYTPRILCVMTAKISHTLYQSFVYARGANTPHRFA